MTLRTNFNPACCKDAQRCFSNYHESNDVTSNRGSGRTYSFRPPLNKRLDRLTSQRTQLSTFSTGSSCSIPRNSIQSRSVPNRLQLMDQKRTRVFVSRHNNHLNVTSQTILEYCGSHGVATHNARTSPTHVILEECPFCSKATNGKADNLFKLYIQIGGGAYFCHRCGSNGSWYDFKAQLGGYQVVGGLGRQAASASSSFLANGIVARSRRAVREGMNGGKTGGNGDGMIGGVIRGGESPVSCLPMPQAKLSACYSSSLLDRGDNDDNENAVLIYLMKKRGLTRTTLRKYGVGRAIYNFPTNNGRYEPAECVTFPWIMRASDVATQEQLRGAVFDVPEDDRESGTAMSNTLESHEATGLETAEGNETFKTDAPISVIPQESLLPKGKFVTRRIKVRAVAEKSWQRLDPPGGGWGLFGLHTVADDATEIVLTEGEYDAMAVWQATGLPAVSLPNGCRSLPVQVLPLLERFEKVYLWMDNDTPGQEGAEKFAKKIGWNRCFLVKSSPSAGCEAAKDANDALLKGMDLMKLLQNARPIPHDRILTFQDLRNEVLDELINPDRFAGVPMPSLPKFTNLIKGFRRGELTVLTGPTGSGKTTFLGQASLDLAEQGINCLWGSFEIKNTRLVHKMLQQFARGQLPKKRDNEEHDPAVVHALDALADRFEELPLYFMRFHGSSEVDQVLDAMEYAVYVNDVEHIILDNLQFMISRMAAGKNSNTFDKFDIQDIAIEKFRKFATEHNVHVTLVVHPRKEAESSQLNISSFYGSAKATQEADTVVILQYDGRRKSLDIKKNRFDGMLGNVPIYFHRDSGRYVEDEQGVPQGATAEKHGSGRADWQQKKNPQRDGYDMEGLDNLWDDRLAPPKRT